MNSNSFSAFSRSVAKWLARSLGTAAIACLIAGSIFSQSTSTITTKPFVAYQTEYRFSDTDTNHVSPSITSVMLARRSDGSEVRSFAIEDRMAPRAKRSKSKMFKRTFTLCSTHQRRR